MLYVGTSRGPAHPGPHLLHRLGDPLPDGRDGRPRGRRSEGIECATPLEAEVRELRLIAQHKPRYNRRSRFPERVHWIKLTREPWPRLSLVRQVLDDDADYLGPYSSKQAAERSVAALHEAFPIRQCGGRMPGSPSLSACALAEMGKCLSPVQRQRAPPTTTPRSSSGCASAAGRLRRAWSARCPAA